MVIIAEWGSCGRPAEEKRTDELQVSAGSTQTCACITCTPHAWTRDM